MLTEPTESIKEYLEFEKKAGKLQDELDEAEAHLTALWMNMTEEEIAYLDNTPLPDEETKEDDTL